jgi:hypothetical protein
MIDEVESLELSIRTGLENLAKQINTLSVGLQNAAPPESTGPAKSILYLTEAYVHLEEVSKNIEVK